jgi:hypothetical protein
MGINNKGQVCYGYMVEVEENVFEMHAWVWLPESDYDLPAGWWIERVTPEALALACLESETLPPLTMYWALRTQMDALGVAPDHRIRGLAELPALVSAQRS